MTEPRSRSATHPPSRAALVISVLTLLIVLSPIVQNWREEPDDGFPLSYFPMFTTVRDGRTSLRHPIGIRADGSAVDLDYRLAGSGGLNQVRRQINRLVRSGRADDLCRRVARRALSRGVAEREQLTAVAIVRDVYRFATFFGGDREPRKREVFVQIVLATVRRP